MGILNPKWDLILNSSSIKEGQSTYARIRVQKENPLSTDSDLVLDSTEYMQIQFQLKLNGVTVEERDWNISVGETQSTLQALKDAGTGSHKISALHTVELARKDFSLPAGTDYIDVYFIKIDMPEDGRWDDTQNLELSIHSVQVYTTDLGQIISISNSGVLGVSTVVLNYDNTSDIWVTPDLNTHNSNLYTIGAIDYGNDSRLFVQAYGRSKNGSVFMPAYKLVTCGGADIRTNHITGVGTGSTAYSTPGAVTDEEVQLLIDDGTGVMVDSGLRFNNNSGQITQTFLYDSEAVDLYIKVQIASLPSYYSTEEDAYYEGKRFKAYNTFIAPQDLSKFSATNRPIAGNMYQLKDTKIYPYVVKTVQEEGVDVLLFENDKWHDMGLYDETLGTDLLGNTKVFRIVLNNNYGTDISFITDPNLGFIHVGEYFGHSKYSKIEAQGSDLITYTLNPNSTDDLTKYNITLSADGYLCGTAFCKNTDFSIQNERLVKFTVNATSKKGVTIEQEFHLTIIPGLGQNFISADLLIGNSYERTYFKTISSTIFSESRLYRASDPRYGLRKMPEILLKENFVNPTFAWTDIKTVKKQLQNGIIDTVSGAVIPDSSFNFCIGNYKVLTCSDNEGNELYDVLYREMLPFGSNPKPDLDPRKYNVLNYFTLAEVYGLRQNILNIVGEDVRNISTDPEDYINRAVAVPELDRVCVSTVDTVPRFMGHSTGTSGVVNTYRPMMVCAYLLPGEGDLVFDNLVKADEHTAMLGSVVEIQAVQFKYIGTEDSKYIEQKFIVPIPVKTLIA